MQAINLREMEIQGFAEDPTAFSDTGFQIDYSAGSPIARNQLMKLRRKKRRGDFALTRREIAKLLKWNFVINLSPIHKARKISRMVPRKMLASGDVEYGCGHDHSLT
jgi:hypothetical protein